MMTEVTPLTIFHVREIISKHTKETSPYPEGLTIDAMAAAYLSKGSAAYCLTIDREPILAAGVMNLGYRRGEAWMLCAPDFNKYIKTCFKVMKQMFPGLCSMHKFRRVQATCFNGTETIFKHLGFHKEAELECWGPNGETSMMYTRIFK